MRFSFLTILLFNLLLFSCKKQDIPEKKIEKSTHKEVSKISVYEKVEFVSKYKFSDFPVNLIQAKKSNIKINTNDNSFTKQYESMIKQTFEKEEVNFAGKYVVNYWGCGSNCAVGIAINGQNGKLVKLPDGDGGYDFKVNSRLLIINPPDSLNYYIKDCPYCKPELYLLDTIKGKFIKL